MEADFDRPRLLISVNLREETEGISVAATGLLVRLIGIAAKAGTTEIAVSAGNVAPYVSHAVDRKAFPARLAELRLRGLVREVRPGIFSIAPELWKVARWDPQDREYFPYY